MAKKVTKATAANPDVKVMVYEERIIKVPIDDPGGGKAHSFVEKTVTKVVEKTVKPEVFQKNFEVALENSGNLLASAEKKITQGWEIDSITLSFSISGEGSIGFATLGAEAGIEITLVPKGKSKP